MSKKLKSKKLKMTDVVEPNEAVINAFHAGAHLGQYSPWVENGLRSALTRAVECGIIIAHPPKGWKIVPIEPDEHMLAQACIHDCHPRTEEIDQWNRDTWSFMLEGSPNPP